MEYIESHEAFLAMKGNSWFRLDLSIVSGSENMKKFTPFILLVCVSILVSTLVIVQKKVHASEELFYSLMDSIKEQYKLSHYGKPKNTDELIAYADHLASRDAIPIWDDVLDEDRIIGNTLSKDRLLADGDNILFQTKADAENRTDGFLHFIMSENRLENMTERSEIFSLLDQMDKIKNDDILQDGFSHTVSRDAFMNNTGIKVLLRTDKFELAGLPVPVSAIRINAKNVQIKAGQSYRITATITPNNAGNKELDWSSSDDGIARVDKLDETSATIIAEGEGMCTITVSTRDGGKTAVCRVSVIEDAKVASVALNKKKLQMRKGEKQKLTAIVKPYNAKNKSILWSSSNKGIADVDKNGIVKANRPGKVKITATTAEGKKTAVCEVTVAAPLAGS